MCKGTGPSTETWVASQGSYKTWLSLPSFHQLLITLELGVRFHDPHLAHSYKVIWLAWCIRHASHRFMCSMTLWCPANLALLQKSTTHGFLQCFPFLFWNDSWALGRRGMMQMSHLELSTLVCEPLSLLFSAGWSVVDLHINYHCQKHLLWCRLRVVLIYGYKDKNIGAPYCY